jgi:hypothetical protein
MKIPILMLAVLLVSCRSLGTPVSTPLPSNPWLTLSYSPGFSGTPPWEMRITRDRRVFLRTEGQTYEQHRLSTTELQALETALERARIDHLQPDYEYGGTDQETLQIAVERSAVRVYGPRHLCNRDEIQRFLLVWNTAVRLVVVPTTRDTKHIYDRCGT